MERANKITADAETKMLLCSEKLRFTSTWLPNVTFMEPSDCSVFSPSLVFVLSAREIKGDHQGHLQSSKREYSRE